MLKIIFESISIRFMEYISIVLFMNDNIIL